jgi:hypothetical protein
MTFKHYTQKEFQRIQKIMHIGVFVASILTITFVFFTTKSIISQNTLFVIFIVVNLIWHGGVIYQIKSYKYRQKLDKEDKTIQAKKIAEEMKKN